jgi:hypothetical protein
MRRGQRGSAKIPIEAIEGFEEAPDQRRAGGHCEEDHSESSCLQAASDRWGAVRGLLLYEVQYVGMYCMY